MLADSLSGNDSASTPAAPKPHLRFEIKSNAYMWWRYCHKAIVTCHKLRCGYSILSIFWQSLPKCGERETVTTFRHLELLLLLCYSGELQVRSRVNIATCEDCVLDQYYFMTPFFIIFTLHFIKLGSLVLSTVLKKYFLKYILFFKIK